MYVFRYYVESGGLASYGPDYIDLCRRAASYVDRVLRGERPRDLPVQLPTKFHPHVAAIGPTQARKRVRDAER